MNGSIQLKKVSTLIYLYCLPRICFLSE